MKTQYLIVDGYNIINSWDELKKIAVSSLENARNRLIDIMTNYQGMKKTELIIVFDAQYVKGKGSVNKYGKVSVVYTKEKETADNYIEKASKRLSDDYDVKVATSDGLVQVITMGKGASRISAGELLEDVKRCEREMRKCIEAMKPVKSNRIMDNLDPETAQWFQEMRMGHNRSD